MKLPEHLALSFLVAELGARQQYGWTGTALVLVAGNLSDLDTVPLLAGRHIYRKYHRIVGHGLPLTLTGPALLALFGCEVLRLGSFVPLWCWLQAALVAHLGADVCFYRWPVLLLWPLSARGWGLGWVRWNDLMPTLLLSAATVLCLLRPHFAPAFGAGGIGTFVLYLAWRAWWPWPIGGWAEWLTGSWALDAAPAWRWLTGDFARRT